MRQLEHKICVRHLQITRRIYDTLSDSNQPGHLYEVTKSHELHKKLL